LRESRRAFTRSDVAAQLSGIRGFFFRRWPLAKPMVRAALREAAFFGCGDISLSSIKPRRQMVVKVRHPYHPYLLAGDLWGFWEGIYGVESLISVIPVSDGHEWEMTVRTVGKRRGKEGEGKKPRRPERDYSMEVCEKCRLPLFPMEIRWDPDLGTIYEAGSYRHLLVTSARGWQEIMDEVNGSREGALPPGMGMTMAARAAGAYQALKAEGSRAAYRNFFMSLPVLGWGKPRRVSRKPFVIDAVIEGVPFPQLLAWKIAGAFEALEDEPADITHMRSGDSGWRYLVGPRLEGSFIEVGSMIPEPGRTVLPY